MRRLVGLLLLLAACSHSGSALVGASQMVGPAGGQVVSADGNLTLTIPAGALPADTEITIRELASSELGPDWQAADVAAAYEFGPDGLVFQQPVTVTLLLDQTPVGPGGVLQAEAVVLFTESGMGTEAAGNQVVLGDADTGVSTLTAEISHFSTIVGIKPGLKLEVTGVPDILAVDQIFNVNMDLRIAADSNVSGDLAIDASGIEPLEGAAPAPTIPVSQGAFVSVLRGPLRCTSSGEGKFTGSAVITQFTVPQVLLLPLPDPYSVGVSKAVVHVGPPPELRTVPTGLSGIEALVCAPPWFPGYEALLSVAASGKFAFINNQTGEAAASVDTPAGATYGAIPLDGAPGVFAFGDWGARLWPFENNAFGPPVIVSTDNITDATKCPNGDLMFTNHTLGQIRYMALKSMGGWELSSTIMNLNGVVSAFELPNGSVLAVTAGGGGQLRKGSTLAVAAGDVGSLYVAADRQSTFTFVAEIGDSLRRVRALGDVAAISYFGNGISFGGITIASRSGGAWSTVFGLVGTSSVGIDLKELPSGNILVAATSFNTNQYRVIEVEPDGAYVADALVDLPAECSGPGHALWLPGDHNELAISCHDSGNLVVTPVTID